MNYNIYNFKGADILALQNEENIVIFMNYKTSDFIFCCGFKGKLSDIDEDFLYSIWNEYFDEVIGSESALIRHCEQEMDNITEEKE
jgi:hypothetical protein